MVATVGGWPVLLPRAATGPPRQTDEDREPVIDLAEMKAFFKALDDAPDDRVAYANRFMEKYTDAVLRVWP